MNDNVKKILLQHEKDLARITFHRKLWLYASSIIFLGIIFLIFCWEWLSTLHSDEIWWTVVSAILIVSVNWWYWAMKVVRTIIRYQHLEYDLLESIIHDLQEIRTDLKSSKPRDIDKHK